MNEIRLGTIGSGMIVRAILANVLKTDGIRLAAVYSRTIGKGCELADAYGAAKVYTDLRKFLADEDVNVVYIASPNLLHYEQAKKALLAGKHVICEKPFCTRAADARELSELAKSKQLFLVEAVPTAFLPNYEVLKNALPALGPIKLVLANYSQYSSRYDNLLAGELPNIFNPAFAGGALMDINFYNIFLTIALFGRPEEAVYHPNLHKGLVDTSGVMLLRYPGFMASCAGAKDTRGVNSYQIEGERGFIYVPDGSNGLREVRIVTGDRDETVNLQPDPDRWLYEVRALTRMLLEGAYDEAHARLETTLTTIEVMERARKAAGILFPGD